MEKAQKVFKTRQEFINYPLVSMANEIFNWVLDELDERTKAMCFDPIQICVDKDRLRTTYGSVFKKNMTGFLKLHTFEELFTTLNDLVNNEVGYEATLFYPNDKCFHSIVINII